MPSNVSEHNYLYVSNGTTRAHKFNVVFTISLRYVLEGIIYSNDKVLWYFLYQIYLYMYLFHFYIILRQLYTIHMHFSINIYEHFYHNGIDIEKKINSLIFRNN